jgi:hypothetical protein
MIYYIIFALASLLLYLGHLADIKSTVLEKNKIWRDKDGGINATKYMLAAVVINLVAFCIGFFGAREGHAWMWIVASGIVAARGVWAFRAAARNRKLKKQ